MQMLIRILSGVLFVFFSIIVVMNVSGFWDNDPETTGRVPWWGVFMMFVTGSSCLFGIGAADAQMKADDSN